MNDENQPSIPGLPGGGDNHVEEADGEGGRVGHGADGVSAVADEPDDGRTRSDSEASAIAAAVHGAAAAASSQQHGDVSRRYFYLTNRLNLNGVLSSRIVAPREAYDKYYADLLDRCPGWVPLLVVAPPPSLVSTVAAERGSGGPVIVEFSGDIRGLVQPDTSNYAYATAIPLCEAVAIHVPDQKAKRELLARSYKNIHVYDDLIQITPQLFAGDTETGAPAPPGPASSVDWQLIDRVRGAVSAAISAAESGEQLALVARCLGAAVSDGVADDTVPWLNLSVLNDFDRAAANTANRDFATSDSLLFKVVYGVLARMDASTAWSPRAFLDAVAQAVKSGSAAPSSGEIAQNLNRVRQIIDVEAEFKPFPARGGLVSAKAMLLFSLRLDLAQLLSWPTAETGADDGTRVVAAIFAGRLRGLSREDTKLRSRDFDDITARWAVGVAARDDPPLGDVAFIAQNDRTELLVGGVVVRRAEALLPDPAKIYRSVERAEQKAVRVKVAKIMNWPVTTVIRIGGDYETREFESGAEIETSGTFEWAQDVDESDFMQWLSESRRDRKFLLRAIASARKNSRGEPSE